MQDNPRIYELHIQPTYAVHLPQYVPRSSTFSKRRVENQKNLLNNRVKGVLSQKSQRKLMNAVNWLLAAAPEKTIFDKATNKRYRFRVNFITLTLPTIDHDLKDAAFKNKLLHNFIAACQFKYNMKNYVWKVEAQKNGNIHAHFTTDCFIHWSDLRYTWNQILRKNGLINSYEAKHKALNFSQYWNMYSSQFPDVSTAKRAFARGVRTSWSDPNTTDIRAVHKVSDIAAYMAKYMAKKEEDRRLINGRLWSCSYALSHANKLVLELPPNEDVEIFEQLCDERVQYSQIERKSSVSGAVSVVGEIFYFTHAHWKTIFSGKLKRAFQQHCASIRHGVDLLSANLSVSGFEPPPQYVVLEVPAPRNVGSTMILNTLPL